MRDQGKQCKRLECWVLDEKSNPDRGRRYWNRLSEDLVLDYKSKPKYKRMYTRGYKRKVKERKEILHEGGQPSP
jgi:hypothetical protein